MNDMKVATPKEVKQLNVPYWMNLELVSGYQDSIASNYRRMVFGVDLARAWFSLAPGSASRPNSWRKPLTLVLFACEPHQ